MLEEQERKRLEEKQRKSEFAIVSLNFTVAMATMQTNVLGSP